MLRSRRIPLVLVLVGILGIAWCLSDRYRVRAALFTTGKLRDRADVDWAPSERPAWHVPDPQELLEPYAPMAREVTGEGGSRERALRLLQYVAELGGPAAVAHDTSVPLTETDDPIEIMEQVRSADFRGNCAHYAFVLHTLGQAAGLDMRMVGISGPRWIWASGHALNEVYLPELDTWMIVDPLFHAVFVDSEDRPLGIFELRDLLLAGRADEVRVVQGTIRARDDTPEEIVDFYALHVPRVMLPGGNNLLEMRSDIYDSWLAKTIRLEQWPRTARRGMENILWDQDRRYLYIDRPEYDDRLVPKYVYKVSWAGIWVGLGWFVLALRRPGKRP